MLRYQTPGVYFEWSDDRSRAIASLRTDIAGFVGIAARGPLHKALKVSSWTQFVSIFGRPIPQAHLARAVRGFFENGGRDCWVVRVADPDGASPARLQVIGENQVPLFCIEATSPGVWGRDISVTLQRTNADHCNVIVRLPDGTQELWRNIPFREDKKRINTALGIAEDQPSAEAYARLVKVADAVFDPPAALRLLPGWKIARGQLGGGGDGLSTLTLSHLSGEGAPIEALWGLAAFEQVDEISILAMPDSVSVARDPVYAPKPPVVRCDLDTSDDAQDESAAQVSRADAERDFPPLLSAEETLILQQALIGQCEKLKDRVAILDAYAPTFTPEDVLQQRLPFVSRYAALYYPWLRIWVDEQLRLVNVPPSGHIAGVYARVDWRVGPHKPPANEILEGVQDVTFALDDVLHGMLNDARVNAIRAYSGRGIRIGGARTLSDDPLWRYVNVRRLLIMIEEAIDTSTQWTVFEPNNPRLWDDIERVVLSYLDGLWQRGMLDGATADEAYSVTCDQSTNPPEETDLGRVICQIGVKPPWPAEFVVVRIGKTSNSIEIMERVANG